MRILMGIVFVVVVMLVAGSVSVDYAAMKMKPVALREFGWLLGGMVAAMMGFLVITNPARRKSR